MRNTSENRWILLIHSIPQKPDYLRVKIRRQLQRTGAIAVKNSIYVLPHREPFFESFQWIAQEIVKGKGEAFVCSANFIKGLSDQQLELLFQSARDSDYDELTQEVEQLLKTLEIESKKRNNDNPHTKYSKAQSELSRFQKRLSEIKSIDFFNSSKLSLAEQSVSKIEKIINPSIYGDYHLENSIDIKNLKNRTWVTRKGVHVDRIASAWIIKKYIDTKATFKFVSSKGYRPKPNELRFDMYEAEFTHEGDLCTFEVLLLRANLKEPTLQSIAKIVHEIDIRDEKFESNETPGIEKIINGICMTHRKDEDRIKYGSIVWESLYESFKKNK